MEEIKNLHQQQPYKWNSKEHTYEFNGYQPNYQDSLLDHIPILELDVKVLVQYFKK